MGGGHSFRQDRLAQRHLQHFPDTIQPVYPLRRALELERAQQILVDIPRHRHKRRAGAAAALTARLAAAETDEVYLDGGTAAWIASGRALTDGEENMADVTDDMWLRPYDRDGGIEEAMNEYLAWEIDLVDQIERDGTARFGTYPA